MRDSYAFGGNRFQFDEEPGQPLRMSRKSHEQDLQERGREDAEAVVRLQELQRSLRSSRE